MRTLQLRSGRPRLMSTTACAALLALLLFWAVGAHNRLVRLNHVVAACHEPIDAQLRLRQQVLKQLLQMSRSFESAAALTASMAAMQMAIDALAQRPSAAAALERLLKAHGQLDEDLSELWVCAQHSEHADPAALAQLAQALDQIHERLALLIEHHQSSVSAFNQALQEWPARLLAPLSSLQILPSLQPLVQAGQVWRR